MFAVTERYNFTVIRKFWIRRWFRTLPNYYIVLLINIVFVYFATQEFVLKDTSNFLYFLFLQNSWQAQPNFFIESWSLCIEEWFYILIPVFLLLFSASKKMSLKRKILFPILLFLFAVVLFRFIFVAYADFGWDDIRRIMPIRLNAILFGVLAAFIKFFYNSTWKRVALNLLITGGVLILLLSTLFYFFIMHGGQERSGAYLMKTVFFDLFSIALAFLIPYFSSMKKLKSRFMNSAFIFISTISYSIYLLHVPVLRLIGHLHFAPITTYFLTWIMTIIVSMIVYNLYESPMTKLREKLSKKVDVS